MTTSFAPASTPRCTRTANSPGDSSAGSTCCTAISPLAMCSSKLSPNARARPSIPRASRTAPSATGQRSSAGSSPAGAVWKRSGTASRSRSVTSPPTPCSSRIRFASPRNDLSSSSFTRRPAPSFPHSRTFTCRSTFPRRNESRTIPRILGSHDRNRPGQRVWRSRNRWFTVRASTVTEISSLWRSPRPNPVMLIHMSVSPAPCRGCPVGPAVRCRAVPPRG